jgi:murein DD-endopeptidase MepM/ murein hydrolase activator NlpD
MKGGESPVKGKQILFVALRAFLAVCVIGWAMVIIPGLLPGADDKAVPAQAQAAPDDGGRSQSAQPQPAQSSKAQSSSSSNASSRPVQERDESSSQSVTQSPASSEAPQPQSSASDPQSSAAASSSSLAAQSTQAAANVKFSISSLDTYPGEFLVLTADGAASAGDISVKNPFGPAPGFFKVDGVWTALLPVEYIYGPGDYQLTISASGASREVTIHVLDKEFQTQNLTVDESLVASTVENDKAKEEYNEKVQPLKFLGLPERLWRGKFMLPVQGARVTTEFGMKRIVNGRLQERHGGIDLACPTGTPVSAAADGVVMFAEFIELTGNTVMIEHGMGLKTWYYHMDTLLVKADEAVKKGQQIGTVGSTGFSTGPHLHFAASVGRVYVNPQTLIDDPPL